jgi:hypothetical protein
MDDTAYLAHAITLFETIRRRTERALAQVDDAGFFAALDPESNSLALLAKHVAGNMISRWTAFLTTDGEKPDRDRDSEFERRDADSRAAVMARWERGWSVFLATLRSLGPGDLGRTVTIRGEPHTVFQAIERQKEHYAYHCGQMVLLAKHFAGTKWTTLSMPRAPRRGG